MAPELIRGDPHSRRPAADVYSYGVVLYEILSGQRPWAKARSTVEVISAVGWGGQRVELSAGVPACPLLKDIMERCLATAPKERPTFKEIVAIIEGAPPGSVSTSAELVPGRLSPATGPNRRRPPMEISEGAPPMSTSSELAPGSGGPPPSVGSTRRRPPPLLPASIRAHLRSGGSTPAPRSTTPEM